MDTTRSASAARVGAADTIRPEVMVLTTAQRDRVLAQVGHRRGTCRHCDGDEFGVGDALYVGFLFVSEDTDAYMVGLTCANPACPAPHTGVRLHRSEFFDNS